MKAKELNTRINEILKEKGFDKGECNFWETRTIVEGITKDILNEIPDAEFYVRSGYRSYDDDKSRNNLYVYTNTHSYIDEDNNHLLCEIKIHRTKVRTRYLTRSRQYSLWAITGVTVKPLKDVEFEEEYKIALEEKLQADREREEREAKARAEDEERQRQYELEAIKRTQKVIDYIKKNNLNVEEFTEMATIYSSHTKYFERLNK